MKHDPTCPVVQQRADLERLLLDDPENEALQGARIEYYGGGDQEMEECRCHVYGRDTTITTTRCPRADEHHTEANVFLRQRRDGTTFCPVHGEIEERPMRSYMTARFDVTDLTQEERGHLALHVGVQNEGGSDEGYPDVPPPEFEWDDIEEEDDMDGMALMVCTDGAEFATVPLIDGNDHFNREAERGALDRAYEAKASNPDSVVTIVIVDGGAEEVDVRISRDDLSFVRESLTMLADLDEGENTDNDRLRRLAHAL